jgi:RNA polymerase sigma-54 factor
VELSQTQDLELKQILSQKQIQSLEILSLDISELQKFLENEYIENPLLEQSPHKKEDFLTDIDRFKNWYDDQYTSSVYKGEISAEEEKKHYVPEVQNKEQDVFLKLYLTSQLDRKSLSDREWEVIDFLINCLDEHGYFTEPISDIAVKLGVSTEMTDKCLERLRSLEPYGIFSSNLQNCLLRQLKEQQMLTEEMSRLIMNHLDDVSKGKLSAISRAMHISTNHVKKLIHILKGLNPYPLMNMKNDQVEYIVPDIYYKCENGKWSIQLNESNVSDYSVNEYYLKMMYETKDVELYEYFKSRWERVQFIFRCIEQRRETLFKISEYILENQKSFFSGKSALKPMTMSEAADAIQMHASTVSRACKGKYVSTPAGVISMRSLFSAAVGKSEEEGAVNAREIKEKIKDIISNENASKPYSDAAIARLLEQQEIHISRRTAAKYREALGIPGSYERKEIF